MKLIFRIIILLTFLGCNSKETTNNNWNIEDLTDEEIDFIKGIYKQEQEWGEYESKEKTLLGVVDIQNLELVEGDRVYHFERRAEHDQYLEIVEIIDIKKSTMPKFKKIKYKISRECDPVIGNKELTKDCIEILRSESGEISRNTMDSLNKLILDNGFWEFTEQESDIRRYTDLLYHGESWSIVGKYAIDYSHINGIDTTISKLHKVYRMIPNDFERFKEIGEQINRATENSR